FKHRKEFQCRPQRRNVVHFYSRFEIAGQRFLAQDPRDRFRVSCALTDNKNDVGKVETLAQNKPLDLFYNRANLRVAIATFEVTDFSSLLGAVISRHSRG